MKYRARYRVSEGGRIFEPMLRELGVFRRHPGDKSD